MKKKINFENARELGKQHPDTFYAPDMEELQKLQAGDTVKVCAYQERFWAEIISITDGMITARVDNHLLTPRLKYNDTIEFHLDNVYDIFPKSEKRQSTTASKKTGKNNKPGGRRL